MAIRQVREIGDEILTKQCKEVTKMTLRTKILIGDMLETMYDKNGVGLAAPQVGVLKKIVGRSHCTDQSGDYRDFRGADRRGRVPECPGKMGLCDPPGSREGTRA